jgi:hypothetical protein
LLGISQDLAKEKQTDSRVPTLSFSVADGRVQNVEVKVPGAVFGDSWPTTISFKHADWDYGR